MEQYTNLDHCWVCKVSFTGTTDNGLAVREIHHIIPRAYGGENGPTVDLCSEHHSKLHRIAECIPKKPYRQWLTGENPETIKKLLWLATRVVNAREAIKEDPNRHVLHTMMLEPATREMIERLKPVIGVRSREAVINYAIQSLYQRNFNALP